MEGCAPVSARLRFLILARDYFTCRYCGLEAGQVELHVDHVVPRSEGGKTVPSNLVTACKACNLGKQASFASPPKSRWIDVFANVRSEEELAVAEREFESKHGPFWERGQLWCQLSKRFPKDDISLSDIVPVAHSGFWRQPNG